MAATPPTIAQVLSTDSDHRRRCQVHDNAWVFDYSHWPLSADARQGLIDGFLAHDPSEAIEALFAGRHVNRSEDQPALHMRLRAPGSEEIHAQQRAFLTLADRLYSGQSGFTDWLHIGIGGSDLGPRLVAEALDEGDSHVNVHWLSTVDGRRLRRTLSRLDPNTTGVVIASKSFGTEETLALAERVKAWLGPRFVEHAWAATASADKAQAFGVAPTHILTFPSWTGGRFSLWSSVGVSAAALIGSEAFEALLDGAHRADLGYRHHHRPNDQTLAVWVALIVHHLRRGLDLTTLGIIAYEPRLALLGEYAQQLFMESLGKRVRSDDGPLDGPTVPLIYGGRGTDFQHSIFQALHQGLDTHPLVLVGSLADPSGEQALNHIQLAHLLAQRHAMAFGRAEGAAHQHMPGNRPVALLLTESLTPQGLGFLLASLEHAVYTLSILWGVNAFDQFGVEEGKRLATPLRERLDRDNPDLGTVLGWDLDHH